MRRSIVRALDEFSHIEVVYVFDQVDPVCRQLSVQGLVVTVHGLDAIDGSPVLDLKPCLAECARGEIRQPEWTHELMAGYWHQ